MQRAEVVFGEVEYGPGGSCGPRIQRDYQLVIMHEGTLDIEIDGTSLPLGTGQAILLCPGRREQFRFTPTAKTRHSWCAVPPRKVPADLRRAMRAATRPLAWTSRLQRLFDLGKECGAFAADDIVIETRRFSTPRLAADGGVPRREAAAKPMDHRPTRGENAAIHCGRIQAAPVSCRPGAGRGLEQTILAQDLPLYGSGIPAGTTPPATIASRLRSATPHWSFHQRDRRSMRIQGPVSLLAKVQTVESFSTPRLPPKILTRRAMPTRSGTSRHRFHRFVLRKELRRVR